MPPEAPEAAVEPQGDGSQPPAPPAPDQPAPPVPDQAPAKPTVPTSLSDVKPEEYRRVFTQRTQLWGAVRRELGLDGDLPTEDMVAMIRDLKSKAEGPPPGLLEGITDPRVIEFQQRAIGRLWEAQEIVHGPMASAAREFAAFAARNADNPTALVEKMYELTARMPGPDQASSPAPAAPAGAPAPPAAPAPAASAEPSYGLLMSDGPSGPVAKTPEVPDELRGTGNKGLETFFRRLIRSG